LPRYTVAHSPDADDLFMYYAIRFGWVGIRDIALESCGLDIETLNVKGTYDATAISFALYPHIKDSYALLRTAASFGEGYGPKLIKRKGESLKRRFKVALSGANTTNALLFALRYPDARPVYKNFLEIEDAVLSGEVDAGVLIHESILAFDPALEVEAELWDIWLDMAGKELPLPLGGMALRRSLPLNRAIQMETLLTKAVEVAVTHKETLSRMLMERDLVRVDDAKLARYLAMYANDRSIRFDDVALEALERLFALGYDRGMYDAPLDVASYLIPSEYTALRQRDV